MNPCLPVPPKTPDPCNATPPSGTPKNFTLYDDIMGQPIAGSYSQDFSNPYTDAGFHLTPHFALKRGTHYNSNTTKLTLRSNCHNYHSQFNNYTCGFISGSASKYPPACPNNNCTSAMTPLPFTGTAFY
jgi:hypothetical protein